MDTKQVIARFETERQALAVMDHPNIAHVFDAATTSNGRPYFVMELVDGIPITRYCDAKRLSVRERIQLFIPVCEAIQHAHQKGIIHRDIKPSNILVAEPEGKAIPKVIDFGLAKALGHQLSDASMMTNVGVVVGMPRTRKSLPPRHNVGRGRPSETNAIRRELLERTYQSCVPLAHIVLTAESPGIELCY